MNRPAFLPALALVSLCGCGRPAPPSGEPAEIPRRIVSLAPNITETVFALGLGDRLVGVTTACTYPEAAQGIPRVGGFGRFNIEAIVLLRPDLVILHREYGAEKKRLDRLGIRWLETGNYFLADILAAIDDIGRACGAGREADELVRSLEGRMARLRRMPATRPGVLVVFGGGDGNGAIHAFGTQCLHHELLEMAGGRNVVESQRPFATLSAEAVLRLDPDIIIELAPDLAAAPPSDGAWSRFEGVAAVDNDRVHRLAGDYTCIPGPRFIRILEDFSRLVGQALPAPP